MNVIPSPPDKRDYTVGACMEISAEPEIPDSFEVWQPPVENQESVGNCVAQTLANIMECIYHQEQNEHRDFSVGYIYGTTKGVGMYPRSACDVLIKEGDIFRDVWECLKENPTCFNEREKVKGKLSELAKRPMAYIRLYTKKDIQLFMLKYGLPVLITFQSSFGLHAVACRGWRNDRVDMHYTNSYGTTNGWDGTGWINYDAIDECWGVIPMSKKEMKDIQGHWAEKYITDLVNEGIISGYEDNTFKPDKPVTRAEVAKMIDLALKRMGF